VSNISKWKEAQKKEESFWEDTIVDYSNRERSSWSSKMKLLPKYDVFGSILLEIGSFISGPIHEFDNTCYKIGIEPLIDKFYQNADSDVHYIKSIGEYLPIKNESCNMVIIWNTLDHCVEPDIILDESKRIVKQKGTIEISINIFNKMIPNKLLNIIDKTHPHHFTLDDLKSLLLEKKLSIKMLIKKKGIYGHTFKAKIAKYFVDQVILRVVK